MSKIDRPASEAELADFVRAAVAKKTKLNIAGGGSKQSLGSEVIGRPVSTTKLCGIELYEPASLTLVAEAGTPLKTLEDELAKNDQHLPFEPADYRQLLGSSGEPTIGGIVACAISGPRRIQVGACRDFLIGVRFVNGEGEIIKSGGRVMKNVTGYDLVKLLAGSYGTLGIITQVSFKLLPAPETTACVLLGGLDDERAVSAMSAALGSPFDLSGAAHVPGNADSEPVTMLRLEGFSSSVSYRAEKLRELLLPYGSGDIEVEREKTDKCWKRIRDVGAFADRPGAVWRISLKPGDSPDVVKTIKRSREIDVIYDWGGGLVWLLTSTVDNCGEELIRASVNHVGGHATLIRRPDGAEVKCIFHPQPQLVAKISTELRNQFDPHAILNPGRMGN
ncbi:MAG: glycolate oxidase subunit GlcE [Hyphomicrobiales bacterium]|nr:glycolate oxidase subunit GlcE [Hyphomicrobiales bacterium]